MTNQDYKRIEKEMEKYDIHFALQYELSYDRIIEFLKKYKVDNFSVHWYDGEPEICYNCHTSECETCEVWKNYNRSDKQLSIENWIDICGPDYGEFTQDSCDKFAKSYLLNILHDEEIDWTDRIWQTVRKINNEYTICLFIYHRDIDNNDDWIVFTRKK